MKKFLILILTFACLVSFVACNGGTEDKTCNHVDANEDGICDTCNEKIGEPNTLKSFAEALAASKPASKKVSLTWGSEYKGEANVTCNADGSETIAYSYTYPNTVSGSSSAATLTDTGSVTRAADGSFPATAPGWLKSAEGIKVAIDQNSSSNFTVNGNTLVGTVAQADTAKVLGIELATDAVLTVLISGGRVVKTAVNFENDGAWEITATYTYAE